MPLYLPQLTRRAFLQRLALAGAAVTLAPTSHAGLFGKSRHKHTFALFSDTHIAADATAVSRQVNMADHLGACVRELAAWPVKPAAVLVNGDLALQAGLTGDYAAFGQSLAPLRALAPIHLTLGNHDDRENFWQAMPHDATQAVTVPHKQVTVIPGDRANWFLLDSLDVTASTPGELGTAQLGWLAQELALRPAQPAIVFCHHNLQVPNGTPGLKDTAALADLFAQYRQVKAFVYGHTHDWHLETHPSGVHLINLPPTGFVFKAGRPSGWVRATLAREGMELELRSLDPQHPEHARVQHLTWRPA